MLSSVLLTSTFCRYGQPCAAGGGTRIARWSFGRTQPTLNEHSGEYFVYLGGGAGLQIWDAWIELEEDVATPVECISSFGVALGSQHIDATSETLEGLLGALPMWTAPIAWVSSYESYQL